MANDEVDANLAPSGFVSHLPSIQWEDLKIGPKLGEGGFGKVYKAHHNYHGDVAVKICKKKTSKTMTQSIKKEVQQMVDASTFGYIVQIRGIILPQAKRECCIVMEYMEHGSLRKFREKEPIPCALKIQMIYEISLAMNYLHTRKPEIIHRDLKLENVFVGSGFKVKVGDLGLATWKAACDNTTLAGTLTHIPPEQKVSPKFDVFSFGILLWELSSGSQPFQYCNSAQIILAIKTKQRPDLQEIPADELAIVKELMQESWQQNPDKRPSFHDIKVRLETHRKNEDIERKVHEDMALMHSKLGKNKEQPASKISGCVSKSESWPSDSIDTPDSPTDSEEVESRFDMWKDKPKPLQSSVDASGSAAESSQGIPMVVSHPQEAGQMPGVSMISKRLADMTMHAAETSPRQETMPPDPGPAAPTHANQTVVSQPSDATSASAKTNPGVHVASERSPYPSGDQITRVFGNSPSTSVGAASQHPPPQGWTTPPGSQSTTRPAFSQPSSIPYPMSGANVNTNQLPPQKTNSGNTITITVSGNQNTIMVGPSGTGQENGEKKTTPITAETPPSTVDTVPITTSQEPVTESVIYDIAEHIGKEYKKLAYALKLKKAKVQNIEADAHGDQHEMAVEVMMTWMRGSWRSEVTKAALAQALSKAGLRNVAEML